MYLMYTSIIAVPIFITCLSAKEVPITVKSLDGIVDAETEDASMLEKQGEQTKATQKYEGHKLFSPPITYTDFINSYFIDARQHTDFAIVFWSRTLYYIGASMQTFFKFYLKDVVGVADAEATIVKTALIGQVCAACTAIPTGLLSDRIGKLRKPFIYFACIVLFLGNVANIFARDEFDIFTVAALLGGANGIYLAMDAALALDTLPNGEEAARFMGVWGIGCFLGSALGPVIGGPILSACGHNQLMPEAYNYVGYAIILGLAAFCFLASGAALFFVGNNQGHGADSAQQQPRGLSFARCWASLRRLAKQLLLGKSEEASSTARGHAVAKKRPHHLDC